ncbi:hypothetical protein EJ08DRAFT_645658 [Tothia fuscella]|uniref:Uncharacterized protein n=1 Tax=Tothia fuscella TaxID=1048955 RepID=A0A9P4P141_9PEZI|nr:hypothetical protein EJ08DRAFT_645658 [Tothia fuscella]
MYNAHPYIRIHRAHSHFRLRDEQLMVAKSIKHCIQTQPLQERDLDYDSLQPHVFATDESGLLYPYIYWAGPYINLRDFDFNVFKDINKFINDKGLQDMVAIELKHGRAQNMAEFHYTSCTISVGIEHLPIPDNSKGTVTSISESMGITWNTTTVKHTFLQKKKLEVSI